MNIRTANTKYITSNSVRYALSILLGISLGLMSVAGLVQLNNQLVIDSHNTLIKKN